MHKVRRVMVFSVIPWIALALVFGVFFGSTPARADDANALIKQFDKEYRQAQRSMFAGKNEQAVEYLERLQALLNRTEAADPNSPKLKAAKNKYKKLVRDLERRTGRDLGAGTTTVSSGSKTDLPPMPQAKSMPGKTAAGPAAGQSANAKGTTADLPYSARKPFQNAERGLGRAARDTGRILDPGYRGSKDQLIANAQKNIAGAQRDLDEARQKAGEKGVAAHPGFDRLAADIAAARKRLDGALAKYGQVQAAAAASAGEVDKDIGRLRQAYNKFLPIFEKAMGTVPYYNDLKPLNKLIGAIEAFEKNDRAALEGQLADFAAKYGSTREEIDRKAESMGYSGEGRASYPYEALKEGIVNIEKTRQLTADDILRRAKTKQSNAGSGRHDFSRIEGYESIRQWGLMAARFDPGNPRVKQFNNGLDAWIASDSAALDAKIDRASWPAQAGDSPSDATRLTRSAREFLDRHAKADTAKGKAPRSIVAVVVTGPWRIFKRNILGEPIQFGLPVVVGEQWEVEKDMDRVRTYHMSMLTEEYKGVKKAPPFIGVAVGDSFYVRPGNIK